MGEGDDRRRTMPLLRLRSVLVLPLLESRRRGINDDVNDVEGVLEPDEGVRWVTNEDSILYAGVEGSSGLSVSLGGNEGEVKD